MRIVGCLNLALFSTISFPDSLKAGASKHLKPERMTQIESKKGKQTQVKNQALLIVQEVTSNHDCP